MKLFKKKKKLSELTDEELDKKIQKERWSLKFSCVIGLLSSIIIVGITVFMAKEIDCIDLSFIGAFVILVILQLIILNNLNVEKRIREVIKNDN